MLEAEHAAIEAAGQSAEYTRPVDEDCVSEENCTGDVGGTRQRLIESAIQVFARNGFEGAGIQEIVASAGVKKPTLYYHFGSKAGLWDAIYLYLVDDMLTFVRGRLTYGKGLKKDLLALMQAVAAYHEQDNNRLKILYQVSIAQPGSDIIELHRKNASRTDNFIQNIYDAAEVEPTPGENILVVSLFKSYCMNLAMGAPGISEPEPMNQALDGLECLLHRK